MITCTQELLNSQEALSVSALTDLIRANLENRFPFVMVRGEITDLSKPPSGHIYFSLKDQFSQLRCVWFASRNKKRSFDLFTGEIIAGPTSDPAKDLRNGLEIVCAGSIYVYPKNGIYQLKVEFIESGQEGKLAQLFAELKKRYAAAGYFNQERKRPLPYNPNRVALITSPGGAAIHDFFKVAENRGISSIVRLFPVPVQGKGAAAKIAAAIELANSYEWAQVITLIRGGGSTEDLWEFNEPAVVEAVYGSKLPVIAGIGHEVDFTLADMIADVRAATPSHAAELLWQPHSEMAQRIDELFIALNTCVEKYLTILETEWKHHNYALGWLSPESKLKRHETRHEELATRLFKEGCRWLEHKNRDYENLEETRQKAAHLGKLISINIQKIEYLEKALSDKTERGLATKNDQIGRLQQDIYNTLEKLMSNVSNKLDKLELTLTSRDPYAPLRKGYALLYKENKIIRYATDCEEGSQIMGRIIDGELSLTIDAINKLRDYK